MISCKELQKLIEDKETICTTFGSEITLDNTYSVYRSNYTQYDGDQWLVKKISVTETHFITKLKCLFKKEDK